MRNNLFAFKSIKMKVFLFLMAINVFIVKSDQSNCRSSEANSKLSKFTGTCTLKDLFRLVLQSPSNRLLKDTFLKPEKWDCKNIVDHMRDNSVHSISCTTRSFIVLQPGEGNSFIHDAQIVARTHGNSFKNLYFKITLNSKKDFFIEKSTGEYEIRINSLSLSDTSIDHLWQSRFKFSYSKLKVLENLKDVFPSELSKTQVSALMKSGEYIEVLFRSGSDNKSYFIFQKFKETISYGFFTTTKPRTAFIYPLDLINEGLGVTLSYDVYLFLEYPASFSSCTSEIPVVLSISHRNLTRDFTTEGSTVTMPEGEILRWRIADKNKVKKIQDYTKSNGIVELLPNEIGLSAKFSQENDTSYVEVISYDNLSEEFILIIRTFVPLFALNEESKPFDLILQKKVLFKKIVFNAKNVEIHGILDEDWYIANNLANLRGMIFKVSALINSNTWTFSGDGEIMVLGEMIFAKLEKVGEEIFLSGDFTANNISVLATAARGVSFLPEDHSEYFKHLLGFPLSSLQMKTSLQSKVLNFYGESLSYANPNYKHEDAPKSTTTNLEIVLLNGKEDNPLMIVGICQNDVLFEKIIEEVLGITVEGLPWLVFEELCFLIAKDNNQISTESYFNRSALRKTAKKGIHYTGKISYLELKCKESISDPTVKNEGDICFFIKNNIDIFKNIHTGEGYITPSEHFFKISPEKESSIEWYNIKSNSRIKVQQVSIQLSDVGTSKLSNTAVPLKKLHHHHDHRNHKKKKESVISRRTEVFESSKTVRVMGVLVNANFSLTQPYENLSKLTFQGEMSSFATSQLSLVCKNIEVKVDINTHFTAAKGNSYAENDTFSFFEFTSPIDMVFHKRKTSFEQGGRLTFDIEKPGDTLFFSAIGTEELNSVQNILEKFQIKESDIESAANNFAFVGTKFLPSPQFVWTVKNSVIVQAGNRTARGLFLTMFGYLERNEKKHEFKIELKKCLLRYQEWLSVTNFSNSNLQLFHKTDYLKGPKLKVNWNFCSKKMAANLTGSVQAIGISGENRIKFDDKGCFKIENTTKFFGEVQVLFRITQKKSLRSLQEINPSFYVNLISDKNVKVDIEKKVEQHFKSLEEKFSKAYDGEEFLESKKNAEGVAYLPASNLANILQSIDLMINNQIKDIKVAENAAIINCVKTCKEAGLVKMPYIVQKSEENKVALQLVPEHFKTYNVTCIADCEIKKMASSENYEKKLDDVKKLLQVFDKLNNEVKEIHTMYTEYAKSVNSKVQKFKTERPEHQSFLPTKMKEIKAAREFFTLDYFNISEEELGDVTMHGDNCVNNFRASYKIFGDERVIVFCQCFNGEFAKYFANKVVEHYLTKSHIEDLEKFLKLHSTYIAEQEEDLKLLSTSLADFYKKYNNPVQPADQPIIAQRNDLPHHFNHKKTLVFNTRTLDLPHIASKDRALLDMNRFIVTRSMETRKAFLYSSPWASLSAFNPESSFKKAEVFVGGLPSNKSSCNAVTDIGNQYAEMYKSIRSISDSYTHSIDRLKGIYVSMQKETDDLKNSNVGTSKETKEEQLYWVRQLERGIQLFSELMDKKLSMYSASALTAFKSKFESALKRNGVRSIDSFMRRLKIQLQRASAFDSTKRAKGLSSASKLSDAMAAIFSNPLLKLDEVTDRIKAMKKYITNIDGMVRSCKSSYI